MNESKMDKKKCKHEFWIISGYWDLFRNGKRTDGGPKLKCLDCGKDIYEDWKKIEKSQRHPMPKEYGECIVCGGDIEEKNILKKIFKVPLLKILGYGYVLARIDLFCKKCGIKHPFPPRG